MEFFGLCKCLLSLDSNVEIQGMYEDKFSRFYDGIVKNDLDIAYYKNIADMYGNEILELGCGSGRVTIPLIESGIKVTGVDMSQDMLTLLKTKAVGFENKLYLIQGDICDFTCDRKFNVAILPEATLNIIENRQKLFHNIYSKLYDFGIFIISYFDYSNIKTNQIFPSDNLIDTKSQTICVMTEKVDVNTRKATVNILLEEELKDGRVKRYITSVNKKIITDLELKNEIEQAGFKRGKRYSNNLGRYEFVHEILFKDKEA